MSEVPTNDNRIMEDAVLYENYKKEISQLNSYEKDWKQMYELLQKRTKKYKLEAKRMKNLLQYYKRYKKQHRGECRLCDCSLKKLSNLKTKAYNSKVKIQKNKTYGRDLMNKIMNLDEQVQDLLDQNDAWEQDVQANNDKGFAMLDYLKRRASASCIKAEEEEKRKKAEEEINKAKEAERKRAEEIEKENEEKRLCQIEDGMLLDYCNTSVWFQCVGVACDELRSQRRIARQEEERKKFFAKRCQDLDRRFTTRK